MAAITRLRAVPGIVLWVVLCLPGPSYATVTIDTSARDVSVTLVVSAPLHSPAQFIRVKADRTAFFSSGCLPAPRSTWLHRPTESTTPETTLAADPPSVVLTCPPLAPRPPPAA